MCTEEYLNKFQDLRDDCEMIENFKLGGTLVLYIQYVLFVVFGMVNSVYNAVSSASCGWDLRLSLFEFDVNFM